MRMLNKMNQLIANRKVATRMWSIARKSGLGPLMLRIHPKSALVTQGWYRSFKARRPIDAYGQVLPWWTYSAIDFMAERLVHSMEAVEFGAGNSTLWLGNRISRVVSFENDLRWAEYLRPKVPGNCTLCPIDDFAQLQVTPPVQFGRFQVAIVDCDGDRLACGRLAADHLLADDGVLLWDNTDGPDWPQIRESMVARSFRHISFTGMVPQEISLSRTTVFYRAFNCLNL